MKEFIDWQGKTIALFFDFDVRFIKNVLKFEKAARNVIPNHHNLGSLKQLYKKNNLKLSVVSLRSKSQTQFIKNILTKYYLINTDFSANLSHGKVIFN